MFKFEQLYSRLITDPEVSPALKPRLQKLYDAIVTQPVNLAGVKAAMIEELEFLTSEEGRTAANCTAVDRFLCLSDDWPLSWAELPNPLRGILDDMGSLLHDAVTAPDVAANFEALPEQLLERTKKADIGSPG